jgi:hypothetical protein
LFVNVHQGRRLAIARELPEAAVLAKELLAFKVKITAAGNETFESWRERDKDDLVLAVALACWWAERRPVPVNDGVEAAFVTCRRAW